MDTTVIHENPVKWALAALVAYIGVEMDVESLVGFTYIVFAHSIVGAIKSITINGVGSFSFQRLGAGFLKYISILLLLMMFSLTAKITGLTGYTLMAKYTVWGFAGVLVYYSVVNCGSIWTGKDHRKEDAFEVLFQLMQKVSKGLVGGKLFKK